MKGLDPEKAKMITDFRYWVGLSHIGNTELLASALGVYRHPSRGRTHMVFRLVDYDPQATAFRFKFRVSSCGVYRIRDVRTEVDAMLGRVGCMDTLLEKSRGESKTRIPLFCMSWIRGGVEPFVGYGTFRQRPFLRNIDLVLTAMIERKQLTSLIYNPRWRERVNATTPPRPMILSNGLQDTEHDADEDPLSS